jgi:hypothetical protein
MCLATVLFGYAITSSPLVFSRASLLVGSAAVGLSAAVPTNQYNALAQELMERDAELDRREAMVRDAEARGVWSEWNAMLAPYSLIASILLFVLLAFNYFLDWRRGKRGYTKSA